VTGHVRPAPPGHVTWTTRLRKDAALYGLPSARTGRRGRPREKGDRLPSLAKLAGAAAFTHVTVTRYGKTASIQAAAVTCLWHSVFGTRPVTVVLIRDRSAAGYDLALVTTDTAASPAQVIERYAARWSVEVAIEDSKQIFGAGQARNRAARAVERAIPFQLACQAIAVTWYGTAGHHPADVEDHRARAPWYTAKARPSTADMAAKLRRVLIVARFPAPRPDQPTPEEINVIRLLESLRSGAGVIPTSPSGPAGWGEVGITQAERSDPILPGKRGRRAGIAYRSAVLAGRRLCVRCAGHLELLVCRVQVSWSCLAAVATAAGYFQAPGPPGSVHAGSAPRTRDSKDFEHPHCPSARQTLLRFPSGRRK
jgi:Transposase DDE domain